MELNYTTIIAGLIIASIAYMVLSMIIREVSHWMLSRHDATFYNSSNIALALTLLILLQAFLGEVPTINILLPIIMVLVLYFMTVYTYKTTYKKAFLMTLINLAIIVAFIMLLAFVMVIWP